MRYHTILICLLLFFSCVLSCTNDVLHEELRYSVNGIVSDGDAPLKSVSVTISLGESLQTGDDGLFEFLNLKEGSYTIEAKKYGYKDYRDSILLTKEDRTKKVDIPLEKLLPRLLVYNGEQKEIGELEFGIINENDSRSLYIWNKGETSLEWEIKVNVDWISIDKDCGTLPKGKSQQIIVVINRDKLKGGKESSTISIGSNGGVKDITVKVETIAYRLPVVNMLDVNDIHMNSATFVGEIVDSGNNKYSERGFVYSKTPNPTLESSLYKLSSLVNSTNKYQCEAVELENEEKYYVKAYAINNLGVSYSSNEIQFRTQMTLPEVGDVQIVPNRQDNNAVLTGVVTKEGEPKFTECGFVYSTSHNPTKNDIVTIANNNEVGKYYSTITGLQLGERYYIKSYATNLKGTSYSDEYTLDFSPIAPSVSQCKIYNIDKTSATITSSTPTLGDPKYYERGFVYGLSSSPTIEDSECIEILGVDMEDFSYDISNLEEGTTYYVRAYTKSPSTNGVICVTYGSSASFTTDIDECVQIGDIIVQGDLPENMGMHTYNNAFNYAKGSVACGYDSGWRLPTLDEMKSIYNNRDKVSNMHGEYWTSTTESVSCTYYNTTLRKQISTTYAKYYKFNMDDGTFSSVVIYNNGCVTLSRVLTCKFRPVREIYEK